MPRRAAGKVAVKVAVDPAALAAVRRVFSRVGEEVGGRALRQVVTEVAKDASYWLKSNLRSRRRTGQSEAAAGGRYRMYRDNAFHVGVTGERSHQTIRDPRFGKVTPTKYFHLIEGGRRAVAPKRAKVLAIKVLRVQGNRPFKRTPGGYRWKLRPPPKPSARSRRGGASPVKQPPGRGRPTMMSKYGGTWERTKKRVRGGYVVFAPRAAAAPGYKVVEREKSRFGQYASSHIRDRLSWVVHQQARAGTQANIGRAANRLARSNP